jgi:hypothetical protein
MASNTVQILRSLNAGVRPPVGHLYGEPYVNFADNQFGVIDSNNNPRDLILSQKYNFTHRNRLINGNFAIDQRNEGALVTTHATYGPDKWKLNASPAGHLQAARQTTAVNGPTAVATHANTALNVTSLTAYTPAAGDNLGILYVIEADTVGDFQFGGSSALPLVLSFWAQVTAGPTGLYSGSLRNAAGTRSYAFTYNVAALGTLTFYQIAIPGDTAGTWVTSGNGASLTLVFDCGSGASFQGAPGSWQTTTGPSGFLAATGANKLVATNGAVLQITNVQLEVGAVATPFELLSPELNLQRCQRYYEKSFNSGTTPGTATSLGAAYYQIQGVTSAANYGAGMSYYRVSKRVSPTVTLYSPATGASGKVRDGSNNADVTGTVANPGSNLFSMSAQMSAPITQVFFQWHWTADADF